MNRHEFALIPALPRRLEAAALDLAIGFGLMFSAIFGLRGLGPVGLIFALFIPVIYEPTLTALHGRTLGHRLLGLRVVNQTTGAHPGPGQSILRFLVKLYLGWITFLTVFGDTRQRAIHDLASSTLVVEDDITPDELEALTSAPARAAR